MRKDDLARFDPDESLLARIEQRPSGMSDEERMFLLDRACEQLAKAGDLTLEEAGQLLRNFSLENRLTIQCGQQFACVSAYGRLLYVTARSALRGACHPDLN